MNEVKPILKLFKAEFEAGNYGYSSTEKQNLKRVALVIESLHVLNNWNLKKGSLFFETLKYVIIEYMKSTGYEMHINNKDKYVFKRR